MPDNLDENANQIMVMLIFPVQAIGPVIAQKYLFSNLINAWTCRKQ
jgi:hypothetical protein